MKKNLIFFTLISLASIALTSQAYTWKVINGTDEPIKVTLKTTAGGKKTMVIPKDDPNNPGHPGSAKFKFKGFQAGACLNPYRVKVNGLNAKGGSMNVCGNGTIRITGSLRVGYSRKAE